MRRFLPIPFALALSACHGPRARAAADPVTTGVVANGYVLGPDGRCSIGIDVATYVLDHREGPRYEERLRAAMRAMDRARFADAPIRRRRAHEVRKAYVKWLKNYYEVSMNLTHGPFRCVAHGHPTEVLNSDRLVESHALFAAYVETLRAIPAPGDA